MESGSKRATLGWRVVNSTEASILHLVTIIKFLLSYAKKNFIYTTFVLDKDPLCGGGGSGRGISWDNLLHSYYLVQNKSPD